MKSTFYVLAICCIALSACGPTYVTVQDQPQQPVQPVDQEVSYGRFMMISAHTANGSIIPIMGMCGCQQ